MSRLSGGGGVVLFEVFFFSLEISLSFFFYDFTCDIFVYLQFPFLSAMKRCSLSFEALFHCYQVSEFLLVLLSW